MEMHNGPTAHSTDVTIQQMSTEQHSVYQKVLEDVAATKHGVTTLDMRSSDHRQFVLDRLGGDEYLERYFPSTRNQVALTQSVHETRNGPVGQTLLEMEEPPTNQWVPLVNVTYLGIESGTSKVVAQGIVTLPSAASSITSNLILVDANTGQVLANITVPPQYDLATQTVEASGLLPDPSDPLLNVVATLTTQFLPAGADASQQVVAEAKLLGAIAVKSVTVLNPNHDKHLDRDYIKVALNRTSNQVGDCDYYYSYGTEGPVPVVGLQVNGSAELVSGFTVSSTPNFHGSCVLMRRSSTGDGATLAFPPDQIPDLCSGAGTAVSWDIGPDWFKGAPWDQNQTIDLDFVLNFNIEPGGTTFVRVTSLPKVVGSVGNIASIDPCKFVWGCVAADTLVCMADGSTRRADTLTPGERVDDGHGGYLRIANVWRGWEAKPMFRLCAASGHAVLLTDEHPVPTTEGVKLARDIHEGDRVFTNAGAECVHQVDSVAYQGTVINVDLLPDGVATITDIDDDVITGFLAGGLLVGDNRMQGVWSKRSLQQTSGDLLNHLGAQWQLDIANSQRLAAGLPLIERVTA